MKNIKFYFVLMSVMCLSFFPANTFAQTFMRNLKLGDHGQDVLLLQQILNKDIDTQISTIGVGSNGYETQFFGLKTESAVKRFQEKYKSEILTPNNLYSATGFVGPSTIKKLNEINGQKTTSKTNSKTKTAGVVTPTVPTTNTPFNITNYVKDGVVNIDAITALSKTPATNAIIFYVAPLYARQGDEIRVYSTKKEEKADIYVAGKKVSKVSMNVDKGYHYFTLPKTNPGENEVWFEANGYKSNSYKINVVKNGTMPPLITSMPENIVLNRENTIRGENFTAQTNIKTSFGVFKATLKGKNELVFVPTLQSGALGTTPYIDGIFVVSNENGESETKVIKYIYGI